MNAYMRCCFIVLVAFVLSCNNSAKLPVLTEDSAKPDGTELNDTTTIISTDTAQAYSAKVLPPAAPQLPLGFYRVKLPCADCPEIEQTVYFERNKTFLMEETDPESHSGI